MAYKKIVIIVNLSKLSKILRNTVIFNPHIKLKQLNPNIKLKQLTIINWLFMKTNLWSLLVFFPYYYE